MKKGKIRSIWVVLILIILIFTSCGSHHEDHTSFDDEDEYEDEEKDNGKYNNGSAVERAAYFAESVFEADQFNEVSVDVHAGYLLGRFQVGNGYNEEKSRELKYFIYRYIYKDADRDCMIYEKDEIHSEAIYEIKDFYDYDKYHCVIQEDSNGGFGRTLPPLSVTDTFDFDAEDGNYVLIYDIRIFDDEGNELYFSSGMDPSWIAISKQGDTFKLKSPKKYGFLFSYN